MNHQFKNLYRNQSSFSLDLAPVIQEFFLDEEHLESKQPKILQVTNNRRYWQLR